MLSHYFVAAQRHLVRRLAYFAINLLGLAVGLAACLLIALYVHDELSYDRFHANAERTYRVLREFDTPSLRAAIDATPMALAPALDGIPGIEKAVRVLEGGPRVRRDGREFIERAFMVADDAFFDVFSFPILLGEARLDRPDTLLITERTAARYFPPDVDPVGSLLEVEGAAMEIIGAQVLRAASTHPARALGHE